MSEDFSRSRFIQQRLRCDNCDEPIPDNSEENDYGEYICLECQKDLAEAAYERKLASDLESPPESSREEQLRLWEEHQRLHRR